MAESNVSDAAVKRQYVKDFITFPDILVMAGLCLIGFVGTLTNAAHWQTWVSVAVGMLMYAISEYLTHRFVFHMKPPKHPLMMKFMKRIHYDHHADPADLHLLFLPVWYSLPNIVVASLVFYFITGTWRNTVAFATGIGAFLLYYEWKHYVAHRPLVPRTSWGRWMKKTHLWHHFKNENYWYGVTHPGMDVLLGTYKDERQVPRSQTAKDLEHRFPEENAYM